MSFKNVWTLKLGYHPAREVFLLINALGAAARRRKESGAGPLLLPFSSSDGERAFGLSFKHQRSIEKLALMHPWKELEMSSDGFNKQRKPTGFPGVPRSKGKSRTWETARGLKTPSLALSATPRVHLCPDLISDCVLKPRGSSDPPQVRRQNPQAPRPGLRLLFPPSEHPGWEKLFLPRSGPRAETPRSAARCTLCSSCL